MFKPQRETTFAVSEPCLWLRFEIKEQFMVIIVKLEFNRFSSELNLGLSDYHCSNIPSVNYQGQPSAAILAVLILLYALRKGSLSLSEKTRQRLKVVHPCFDILSKLVHRCQIVIPSTFSKEKRSICL